MDANYYIRKFHKIKLIYAIRQWRELNNLECSILTGLITIGIYYLPETKRANLKQYLETNHPTLIKDIDISNTRLIVYIK